MKEINLPSGNYLFVEVPGESIDYKISGTNYLCFKINDNWVPEVPRLLDNYTIISTTKDITEEQIYAIIDSDNDWGEDDWSYNKNYITEDWLLKTAKESLQSLIQANKLDVTKNYLILKML